MTEEINLKLVCNLVEVYGHAHSGPVIAEVKGVLLDELVKELLKDNRIIKIVRMKHDREY